MRDRKRPRIARVETGTLITDPLEFTKNLASENVKYISTFVGSIELEIWFDKHYFHRYNHGDENGKRERIDFENVKLLVEVSFRHLLFYASKNKLFHFLNKKTVFNERCTRVVLQDSFSESPLDEILNIIVEFHAITLNKYQATLITAMSCEDFKMSEGQFAIEVNNDSSSSLKQKIGKQLKEIDNI